MDDTPDLSVLMNLLSSMKSTNDKEKIVATPDNLDSKKEPGSFDMPDIDTIMKFAKIAKEINASSPAKDLLLALKPFLKDNKKSKVDNYVKLIGMSNIFETLRSDLGDLK